MNEQRQQTSQSMIPLELRAPSGGTTIQIDWADGHAGEYTNEQIRGFCPCAYCQGHQGPIVFREGGNTALTDIEEIGNYAVKLTWADAHNTGIYSFRYLRELCECATCASGDLRARSFGR